MTAKKSSVQQLTRLRSQIDRTDKQLLKILGQRSKIVSKIAILKAKLQIPVLQKSRQQQIQAQRPIHGATLGLDPQFVARLFSLIQKESVREQNRLQKNLKSKAKKPKRRNKEHK